MMPCILGPAPPTAKQPLNMMLPAVRFKAGMVLLGFQASLVFLEI